MGGIGTVGRGVFCTMGSVIVAAMSMVSMVSMMRQISCTGQSQACEEEDGLHDEVRVR